MADYYPLLARALDALPDRTPALRKAVYDRARNALISQLRSLDPPLSESDIDLERRALDAAIERLEIDHGGLPAPANDAAQVSGQDQPEMCIRDRAVGDAVSDAASSAAGAAKDLAKKADIPVGGGKVFDSAKVVITQPTEGDYKAFSAVCTHQGCTVSGVEGGTINCACHGSTFDIATGEVKGGPATKALSLIHI